MSLAEIAFSVVIVFLLADKWIHRASCAVQREEYQSAFREGGRAYLEGYKLSFREFKTRDDDA